MHTQSPAIIRTLQLQVMPQRSLLQALRPTEGTV